MCPHFTQTIKNDAVQCKYVSFVIIPAYTILYVKYSFFFNSFFFYSEQMNVLRENGRLRSLCPEDTPMAMLQDITHVLLQLKNLINKPEDHAQQYTAGTPTKRQRMS